MEGACWNEISERKPEAQGRNVTVEETPHLLLADVVRMCNSRNLTWWAMIQSTVNFGWGVGAILSDINCYWGNTVSSLTRSTHLSLLTTNMVFPFCNLLKRSRSKLFTFDNFQIGQEIKDQCGGHLSTFFKGTHMCTHRVFEYDDTSRDTLGTKRSGMNDQALPSPTSMPKYKNAHVNEKLGNFICIHPGTNGEPEPEFGGDRVREYIRILRLTLMTNHLRQVLSRYADCAMFYL